MDDDEQPVRDDDIPAVDRNTSLWTAQGSALFPGWPFGSWSWSWTVRTTQETKWP